MHPNTAFMRFLQLACYTFLVLSTCFTYAQVKQDTITQFDPNNPTHLIIEYEQASQSLLEIKNKLMMGFSVDPIRHEYENIQSRLDIYQRIGDSNLDDATLSHMNDLISIFERQLAKVADWQTSLVENTKILSDYRIVLSKHIDRLRVSTDSLDSFQLQYYESRHIPLINQADSLNLLVENKIAEILKLEYRISQDYTSLYSRIQQLKNNVARYWDNLVRKEEVNWKLSWADKKPLLGSGTLLSNTTWRIVDFFKVNADRTFYLFLIAFGAYLLLRHFKKLDEVTKQEPNATFYRYPISTSLLLAGMLFSLVFPPTTSLMYDFALLASFIPFLYILKGNLEGKQFRSYVIFFIFLLILKIQGIFSSTSGFMALITIACGVVLIITIYSQTLRKFFKLRWGWVKIINWLFILIILAGIISILTSRVRLGVILINGTAETIALGLILIYLANWSDRLIGYIRNTPTFKFMAKDRAKVDEFWLTWSNRIYLFLLIVLLISFLKNFSIYTSAKDAFLAFFNTPRVVGDLSFTYGGIALFLLVIYLAAKLSSTVKFLTEEKSFYKNQKSTANIAVIIRFFLITGGFFMALLVSGIPIDRITIILGALSVGIGFGLQNIVNNLISGIILIFERPIQTGDLVELQQYTGFVKDIGLRASVIRTYDGAEVIVPNGALVSQEVINWTLSSRERRVEMRVGVAYGSDVKQVIELISKVLKEHPKVESYPEPAVLLDGFGDSSVDFRCLIWTVDIDHWLKIKSEISTQIYNALKEADITIPFPQRDLHIVSWNANMPSLENTKNTNSSPPTDVEIPSSETGFESEESSD